MIKLKTFKVFSLAILGGINVIIDVATPIVLVLMWQRIFGLANFGAYLFYTMGLLASVFRGIKIGWMKW